LLINTNIRYVFTHILLTNVFGADVRFLFLFYFYFFVINIFIVFWGGDHM